MDKKSELLVCIGASVAANCVPCFDYYFKKASSEGISLDEVREAIELACKVKTGAGIAMKNSIRETTGQDWGSEPKDAKADCPCCK